MKKYRARWNEITEVDVERETDAFVIIGGRRNAKRSDCENFYDTHAEAVSHILDTQRAKVKAAEGRLAIEVSILAKLEDKYSVRQPNDAER
jgi:hypothetical protein